MGQLTKRQAAWRGSVSPRALLASLGVTSLGMIGLSASTSESWAACTVTIAPNYVCSGAEITPQTVNANNAAVSTSPGFSVNVNGLSALTITGNGALSYIDTNASTLTSTGAAGTGLVVVSNGDDGGTPGSIIIQSNGAITGGIGIDVTNQGSGTLSVTTSGLVTGTSGEGILAYGGTTGTGLSVNAAAVTGATNGIFAENQGGGLTSVTASGAVNATGGHGIYAYAMGTMGTGLSVDAADVTATFYGISARNDGGGLTSVKTSGTVSAGGHGIYAFAGNAAGTGLSVEAATVSGGSAGIYAQNNGGGLTSVKATGTVTGTNDNGIHVYTANVAGTGLSVEAAAVSGNISGIYAQNLGGGLTSVKATGTVTGTLSNGIDAYATNAVGTGLNIEAAAVTGGNIGIVALNNGGGLTKVKATGTVTGTGGNGIHAYANNAAGTGLSVGAAAVTGAANGIHAQNTGGGITQVAATGQVTGTSGFGIVATNSQLIISSIGNLIGISGQLTNPATDVIVQASGGVTGGITGVLAFNSGVGQLQVDTRGGAVNGGTREGISALNSNLYNTPAQLSVTSDAASGARHGILAMNAGTGSNTVTAHGAVSGGSGSGIVAVNGAFDVSGAINSGTFAPTGSAGTDLTVNANGTVSGTSGIYANNRGSGLTKVTAYGSVNGTIGEGIVAYAGNLGAGLSVETAAVTGNSYGILTSNFGGGLTSVKATGTVTGTNNTGISANAGTPGSGLSVEVATVTGGNLGINALNIGGGLTSVKATGAITGTGDTGLYVYAGSAGSGISVDVAAVTGRNFGINAQNYGGGTTKVKATGPVSGAIAHGIFAYAGAAGTGLSVEAADVSGASRGIYTDNKGSGPTQITAGGMVSGSVAAIDAIAVGTPIIIDVTATGGLRNASGAMTGLMLRTAGGPATLTNAGVITGIVQFGASGNTFDNSGTWNTAGGTSMFGGVTDVMTNRAGGILNAAGVGAVATTTFDGLGSFVNQGRVTLVNGKIGDVLKINGNARFDSGSVYALDIDGAGNSDKILISGSAQLGGTLSLNAPVGTQIAVGTRYTVLTATGGVSGKWSSIQGTAFLSLTPDGALSDTYDANNSYLDVTQLTLVQPRPFMAAALTPNQINTAFGLDSIPKSGALFSAVGLLPNDVAARNAFDQLSGEAHSSARTALVDSSYFVRAGMLDRLRSASNAPGAAPVPVMSFAPGGPTHVPGRPAEQFSLWGQAYGAWGRWNGNGNAAGLHQSLGGLSLGLDTPLLGTSAMLLRVGVMAGYGNSSFSVGARGSSGISDNYHLGAYAGAQFGGFGLRAGLAHTWHDIRTTRIVNFPGFNDMLRANYAGRTTQLFGDLGYKMNFGAFALEPFANLAYVNMRTSAFREVGGPAALTAAAARSSQTFTTLGARGAFTFDIAGMATTLRGTLGWRHAFGAVIPGSAFAFAGGAPFSISGIAIARNAALVEAGLDIAIAPGATLGLAYNGQLAKSAQDHAIKGNLAVRF